MATYDDSGGGKVTVADARTYARSAGFTGSDITTAVAIAIAESSLDPKATGSQFGEKGLWQIYPAAWPNLDTKYDLYDPAQNAQAAHEVYTIQGWKAWTTYNNGAYLANMKQAAGNETSTTELPKILPNAVAVSEWSSPINGSIASCSEAAVVCAAHIIHPDKVPATTNEVTRIATDASNQNEASHDAGVEGSMNDSEGQWAFPHYYGFKFVNAIGSSLGCW